MSRFTPILVTSLTFVLAITVPGRAQTLVNDNDPSVVYSLSINNTTRTSDWTSLSGIASDYGGNEHSTNFSRPGPAYQGATVSITFTGTEITWYGTKGPNYGYAVASLETGASAQFNGYSESVIHQNPNVTLSAPYGYHVLTIKLLHEKQGSDYYQTVDHFAITGGGAVTLAQGSAAGYDQWDEGALSFHSLGGRCPYANTSDWSCYGPFASDLSGGHFWDNTANDTISYKFTGTLIELYGRPDAENGYFNVAIDGKNYGTYDENFSNIDDDSLNAVLVFAAQLASGAHTITVTVVGRNDGYYAKHNNYVQLDEFVSFGGSPTAIIPPVVGTCQYELSPQGAGKQPFSFAMATKTGISPPAMFWDAGGNQQLERYQNFYVPSNPYQNFTWTALSPGYKICTEGGSQLCLSAKNGLLKLSTLHDVFQILSNDAVLDVNSCSFIQNPAGITNGANLTLGTTESPWVFSNTH